MSVSHFDFHLDVIIITGVWDPIWVQVYSQTRTASLSGSKSIFTHMLEEWRQRASVTVTHRIAHEISRCSSW